MRVRRVFFRWLALVLSVLALALVGVGAPPSRADEGAAKPIDPKKSPGAQALREAAESSVAEATSVARQSGKPVEVAALGSEKRKVVVAPNGRMEADFSPVPFRVKRGGVWVDASAAEVSKDKVVLSGERAGIQAVGGRRLIGTLTGDGETEVSLLWESDLPSSKPFDGGVVFEGVRPGVDLVVRRGLGFFSTFLIVRTREAAERLRSEPAAFEWRGGSVVRAQWGGFEVRDGGRVLAYVPKLFMWDGVGARSGSVSELLALGGTNRVVELAADVSGARMSVGIPGSFDLAKATYPLVVDPEATGPGVNQQSFRNIDDYRPEVMAVGFDGWNKDVGQRAVYRTVTSFDLSAPLKLGVVESAVVLAKQTHSPRWGCDREQPLDPAVGLYLTGRPAAVTTWRNQPGWLQRVGATTYGSGPSDRGCAPHRVQYDASGVVRTAMGEGWDDISFGLMSDNEGDLMGWRRGTWHDEEGWWPRLHVVFGRVPDVPSWLWIHRNVANHPTDNAIYVPGDGPLRFSGFVKDPDGDAVKLRVNVLQGGNVVADGWSAAAVPSRSTTTVDLGLAPGRYWWRARAEDQSSLGLVSGWVNVGDIVVQDPPPPPGLVAPSVAGVERSPLTFSVSGSGNAVNVEYRINEGGVARVPLVNGVASVSWVPDKGGPFKFDVRAVNFSEMTSGWVSVNGLVSPLPVQPTATAVPTASASASAGPKAPALGGKWLFDGSLENSLFAGAAVQPKAGTAVFGVGESGKAGDSSLVIGEGFAGQSPKVLAPTDEYSAGLHFAPSRIPEGKCVVASLLPAGKDKPMAVIGLEGEAWFGAVADASGAVAWLASDRDLAVTGRFQPLELAVVTRPASSRLFYFKEQIAEVSAAPAGLFDGQILLGGSELGGVSYPACVGRLDNVVAWTGKMPAAGFASAVPSVKRVPSKSPQPGPVPGPVGVVSPSATAATREK